MEPISTIIVVITGTALAIGMVNRVLQERKGGQVVDARPDAKHPIYRDPNVTYGLVVVFTKDGAVTIDTKKAPDMLDDILRTITDIAKQGAAPAAQSVKEQLDSSYGTSIGTSLGTTASPRDAIESGDGQ